MSHQPFAKPQRSQPRGARTIASSVLILEAAIATIVLSFFASSSPSLFTAQLQTPPTTSTQAVNTPQNSLFATHWSRQRQN